ncbi:hypothetical protein LEP1GSC038_0639 [Leptospira weilii str. 2006001855]|uniref:Uncharacterized protein n=1 Tax=Leptospira weilii str. 2006001855 TaxID=996804 RepID=M6FFD9_9LEPT|nr:hypothetical protein LEP1GSC038_0639 [Leptospira weilii str. 2006001855]
MLDDEGKTLSKMQYLPYGETFVQRGDLNFAPKYNSQELDRESGFTFTMRDSMTRELRDLPVRIL